MEKPPHLVLRVTYIILKWITVMICSIHDHSCVEIDGEDQDQASTTDPQGSENRKEF
jgi:hypothetical protein